MEYFELIRTIEFDIKNDTCSTSVRIELLKSNIISNKYRAKSKELTTFNLYPTFLNMGPHGEALQHFHSSDSIWRELFIINDEEIYLGFVAENDESALNRVISELLAAYEHAKNVQPGV